MRNNIRRNRNIGTSKQGYGQNNKMKIPDVYSYSDLRWFPERLESFVCISKSINGHEFQFIIEQLKNGFYHACSVDDVASMIKHIPKDDYGDIKYIIFRQPKKKEKILSSVWGRLIYSYELGNSCFPAIILEATALNDSLKWTKRLSPYLQLEVERLKKDGHIFKDEKKYYSIRLFPENVRRTQLYRTLFHEFGHYVQYLNIVERAGSENEDYEDWEKRYDAYHKIKTIEKEVFANNYAYSLREKLEHRGIVPRL
jgi:hypothetical protein